MAKKMFKISFESYGLVSTICVETPEEANAAIDTITNKGQHACVWYKNTGYDKEAGKTIWAYQGCNALVNDAKRELFGIVDEFEVAYMKDGVKHTHKDTQSVCYDYFEKVKKAGLPVYVTRNGKIVTCANLPVKANAGKPVQA